MFTTETKVKTSKGYPAKIINTDMKYGGRPDVILCFINLPNQVEDTICLFNLNGDSIAHNYGNLIEIGKWDDFNVDDPVVVKYNTMNNDSKWFNAHYAGYRESASTGIQIATVFSNGCSGWGTSSVIDVLECRRPTKEEIELYQNRTGLIIVTEKQDDDIFKYNDNFPTFISPKNITCLGDWNPNTNIPTIYGGIGAIYNDKYKYGDYYKVNEDQILNADNPFHWNKDDIISFNGKEWVKYNEQN